MVLSLVMQEHETRINMMTSVKGSQMSLLEELNAVHRKKIMDENSETTHLEVKSSLENSCNIVEQHAECAVVDMPEMPISISLAPTNISNKAVTKNWISRCCDQ